MADTLPANTRARGLTVLDVARRYRVSPEKVRGWIRRGELAGINTGSLLCGKSRFVITVDSLAAFERSRSAAEPPRPPRSRIKRIQEIDFYPD